MNTLRGVFIFYVGRIFLIRFAALLIFFVVILQMLDLLNRTDDLMAVEGADFSSILRYISLQAPQLIRQFTPFAALLAIVLTLAGLSHTSEITVMRAAGLSVHRVLAPLGVVCALIAVTHFIFNETVAVRAAEKLDYWAVNDYALDLEPESETRTDIWIQFDNETISAASAARFGDAILLTDVTIRSFDDAELISSVTRARAARHIDGAWRLYGVRMMQAGSLEVESNETAVWTNALDPEFLFALTLEPDQTTLGELAAKIGQLREDNADTRAAMTSLLSRFSQPMATLVMPLLGAIAGFGIHRQGVLLARAVSGSALGFAYFVAENLALALGKLGVLPAIIGAFFPFALFMVVGFAILLAMEN